MGAREKIKLKTDLKAAMRLVSCLLFRYFCSMNHEEIKRYFENNPPPKEVRLTEWANITDTQVFLRSCYSTIRNFNGPIDRCPAWWHLRDFYLLIKKTPQQQSTASEQHASADEAVQNEETKEEEEEKQVKTETAET
ncbi:DUF6965 family protein [Flavobacterium notoginsengisoli]|uniref:DUF6965 family protein n=1 Tax=Flavobacterium notoginsengisoli TaxID=1478199 RepID=UPI003631AAF5